MVVSSCNLLHAYDDDARCKMNRGGWKEAEEGQEDWEECERGGWSTADKKRLNDSSTRSRFNQVLRRMKDTLCPLTYVCTQVKRLLQTAFLFRRLVKGSLTPLCIP